MDKSRLYRMAYRMIGSSTPLKIDCGKLCEKACCHGDKKSGMYLFPGEEKANSHISSYAMVKESSFVTANGKKIKLAVCNGTCNRDFRPLSCRIFPLFPIINDGKIELDVDVRSYSVCPLAWAEDLKISFIFKRKVKDAIMLLCRDEDILDFLKSLSEELSPYRKLIGQG